MMSYDVAVVGGGPAGCSAAITLAARGARVALLEARTYPHDKVCGEFLSPECGVLLDVLGVGARLQARGPTRIGKARITAPDGTARQVQLHGTALGISRSVLDETLAQQAREVGADVLEATKVSGLVGNLRDGFQLQLDATSGPSELRARSVLVAHGRRGALDSTLRRPFLRRHHPHIALKNHFHGPPLQQGIELHAFPGGYCGVSQVEAGKANVCLLAHESLIRDRGVPAFLEWMQAQNRQLRDWLSRAEPVHERWLSISNVPMVRKGPVSGDLLMVGDAAALIAPLVGDGIAMALRSGQLAALCTAEWLEGRLSARQLRQRYASEWRHEFGTRLMLARGLHALMLRPWLLIPGLRLAAAVPPLGSYVVAHTRGG